jgi:hypothetical protein
MHQPAPKPTTNMAMSHYHRRGAPTTTPQILLHVTPPAPPSPRPHDPEQAEPMAPNCRRLLPPPLHHPQWPRGHRRRPTLAAAAASVVCVGLAATALLRSPFYAPPHASTTHPPDLAGTMLDLKTRVSTAGAAYADEPSSGGLGGRACQDSPGRRRGATLPPSHRPRELPAARRI